MSGGIEPPRGRPKQLLSVGATKDELPEYRKIAAPLHLDAMNMRWLMKGQQVSPTEFPDFAKEKQDQFHCSTGPEQRATNPAAR